MAKPRPVQPEARLLVSTRPQQSIKEVASLQSTNYNGKSCKRLSNGGGLKPHFHALENVVFSNDWQGKVYAERSTILAAR
jgi:hypothetical protein